MMETIRTQIAMLRCKNGDEREESWAQLQGTFQGTQHHVRSLSITCPVYSQCPDSGWRLHQAI